MNGTIRTLIFSLLLLFIPLALHAQTVSFETNAPSIVAVGENFRIEYVLINADPGNFPTPNFEGFNLVAGPAISEGFRARISGNSVSQIRTVTYTFVLRAENAGTFTIPSATITTGGKSYRSNAIPVEVVAEKGSGGQPPAQQSNPDRNNQGQPRQNQQSTSIAGDDIILRVSASKTNVFRGEPVRVVYKLYTRVPLSNVENIKVPSFNGFWAQELDTGNNKWQRETLNNKVYEAVTVREVLLYPQQAGTLTIDPYEMNMNAQIVTQSRRQSILDEIFGGGPSIQEERKRLSSGPLSITVNELPSSAPEGFTGAVGNFTLSAEVPSGDLAANSSATYTIKISGTGNLPLIQAPKIEMPTSFEQYNVKTTESFTTNANGINGYRQFEYPFIARAEGEYEIEPVLFTYFNPETARYVTLSTETGRLNITPDDTGGRSAAGAMVSGITKEDIKLLGQDIRFIKIGNPVLRPVGATFIFSWLYFLILFLVFGLFFCVFLYLRKVIKERDNVSAIREKRANRIALARLKMAEDFMKQGNERRFHDELLKALWGYMSDKLNIPVANLTKENVREGLLRKNIPLEMINRYTDLISESEYAQYSPAEESQMPEIYRSAVSIISKIESFIKK